MKALWPTVVKVLFLALFVLQGVEGKAKVRDSDDGNTAIQSEVCVCSGSNKGFNSAGIARFKNVSLFPDDYGTSCKAWDKVDCPQAWPGETYGPWCCMSWCYVSNATCTDAIASVESPGLFYSYFGPCGIDTTQINATSCSMHQKWDDVSNRASVFLKHLMSHAAKVGEMAECAEEEEEDKTELKALSLLLGISIVGAGVGVLIFVWIIRCDPAETRDWLYETLCLWSSQSDKANEAEDDDLNPNEQPTFPSQSKSKLLSTSKPVLAVGTSKRDVAALSSGTSLKRNLATVTD